MPTLYTVLAYAASPGRNQARPLAGRKMKLTYRVFLTMTSVLLAATAHAMPTCLDGQRLVSLEGEIHNNAIDVVSFDPAGQVTLGVVRLKLFAEGDRENLTCTLLGEPTGLSEVGDIVYDHIITCDDPKQSELSFRTKLTGRQFVYKQVFPDLLKKNVSEEFCRPYVDDDNFAFQAFTEKAKTNPDRNRKGVFADAQGSLGVAGCVNVSGGAAEINMMVKGNLCLSNW